MYSLLKLALSNIVEKQKNWLEQQYNEKNIGLIQKDVIYDLTLQIKTKSAIHDLWILNGEFVYFQECSGVVLEEMQVDGEKLLQDGSEIQTSLQAMGID